MSSPRQKQKRNIDATAVILGSTIVVLATIDLLVWASLRNGPNPFTRMIAEYTHASAPTKHVGAGSSASLTRSNASR
jgi:hypothetical protein